MFKNIFILLVAIYLISLVMNGKVSYYVNIVYAPLIGASAMIMLLISLWQILIKLRKLNFKVLIKQLEKFKLPKLNLPRFNLPRFKLVFLSQICFLFLILVISPASLGSAIADNRILVRDNVESEYKTSGLLSLNTEDFNLEEWFFINQAGQNLARYEGELAKATGQFISMNNKFLLARYKVSCCAVDAAVIGIEIKSSEQYEISAENLNNWYELEAEVEIIENDIVFKVINLTKVEKPSNPYF